MQNYLLDVGVIALVVVASLAVYLWRRRLQRLDQDETITKVIQFVDQTIGHLSPSQKKHLAIDKIKAFFPKLEDWKIELYLEAAVIAWRTAQKAAGDRQIDE